MAKIQKGVNDLETWCLDNGEIGTRLIQEWTGDCDDGKHYEIDGVSFGSNKKFKWRCSEGHEWFAVICNRTGQKQCCPYCSGKRVSDMNSLKTWCLNNGDFGQQLMQEWTGQCEDGKYYEIDEVAESSKKRFKWRCSEGHEWVVSINSRTNRKTWCAYCANAVRSYKLSKARLIQGVNDLKTWCLNNGDFGQQLMQEWTGDCEDGKVYGIDEITESSNKRFKWRCSEGHEWVVSINNRTNRKSGCAYCANAVRSYKLSKARLIQGVNDLKTWCLNNGDFGQQLMQEWTGQCEDGKYYEIDEVAMGTSRKKFKWRCSEGHEWFAVINSRSHQKLGCPYCSNDMRGDRTSRSRLHKGTNDLQTWCLANGDFGQQLLNEWTGQCDDGKHYEIDEVSFGSTKKFKWRCSEGHTWVAPINNRTKKQANCLKCRSQSAKSNKPQVSLKNWCSDNSALGKLIESEWTGICEDGKIYELSSINIDDNRKFKWKCGNGHEWIATVNNRIRYKSTCSKCRVISETDNLEVWCKNNGEIGQRLIAEWTGECADGSHLEMRAVPRSSRLQFKWRCSKGHEWYQQVANRTSKYAWASRYGCPICGAKPPAYPVQVLYFGLRQIFPRAEANCSVLRTPENPKGIKFSIAIPEIPLCIDYLSREDMTITDGKYTQKYMEQDSKRKLCRSVKVKFIQIIEDVTQKKEGIIPKRDKICFKPDPNNFDEQLKEVMTSLLTAIGQSSSSVNMDLAIHNAWLSVNGTVGYNESLAYLYPYLAQEWHPELNKYIKPNQARPSLNKVIYWVCPNCGRGADGEWAASISLRVRTKSGCRKCGHNWFKVQQGLPQEYRGKYK